MLYFRTNFLLYFRTNFGPYFNMNFTVFIQLSPLFCHNRLPHIACFFALPYEFFTAYFYMNFLCIYTWIFSSFLSQIRLPRLFCFYNLTKRSSYILLYAVPLKTMILIYYLYYSNFWCKTHLTMSMIVLFHHFHQLVLSLKTVL